MRKPIPLISVVVLIASSLFFILPSCSAAELSSKEIRRIEKGIEKIKNPARGIQRQGYKELEKIGPVTAPYLVEVLKDKSVNRESRTLVCDLLGELKAISALIEALKDEYKDVQLRASYSLKDLTGKHFGRNYSEWSSWHESQK